MLRIVIVSSVSRRKYFLRSICFTVFAVFASQYLQYLQYFLYSSVIVCTAYCTLCSIPVLLAASLRRSPTKRTPDVFIVEITSRSGRKHEHSSEKGEEEEKKEIFLYFWVTYLPPASLLFWNPIKPAHCLLLPHIFLGTLSNLD